MLLQNHVPLSQDKFLASRTSSRTHLDRMQYLCVCVCVYIEKMGLRTDSVSTVKTDFMNLLYIAEQERCIASVATQLNRAPHILVR